MVPCFLSPVLGPMQLAPIDGLGRLGRWVWRIPVLRLKRLFLRPVVTERIVELPFVLRRLPQEGGRVLDFGCGDSALSIEMASSGYKVTGVDLRPYAFRHPGFEFVQGDFLDGDRVRGPFDAVTAVSSVEHCGLEAYGGSSRESGDRRAVRRFLELLRPGGRLLLTVPYGAAGDNGGQRVYDARGLAALLEGFDVRERRYYRGEGCREWVESSAEGLAGVDSLSGYTQGVALVMAVRPED